MPSTKKLLSITNLKKYFPVAKTSIFQRTKRYVRANEDISIDIYEGETLGVVGESGCGKSTLGRVLLQLYPQTAGCSLYYGTTLDELTPAYVYDTLKNQKKYRRTLDKASAKVRDVDRKVQEAGGEDGADFYLLQEQTIAHCEEQTHLSNIVKILGGFYAKDDPEGIRLLLELYQENKKRNRILAKRNKVQINHDHFEQEAAEAAEKAPGKEAALIQKKERAAEALKPLDETIARMDEKIAALQDSLDKV